MSSVIPLYESKISNEHCSAKLSLNPILFWSQWLFFFLLHFTWFKKSENSRSLKFQRKGLFFSCRIIFPLKQCKVFTFCGELCFTLFQKSHLFKTWFDIKSCIYRWVWTSLISVLTESVLALSVSVLFCFVSNLGTNKATNPYWNFLIKTDSHLFFCSTFCKLISQFLQVQKTYKCFLFNHMFQLSFFQNIKADVKLNSWSI